MGIEYSIAHAADLAANLPPQSRCMCALEPALEWDRKDYLLAEAVNMLRLFVWMQTKDGHKGRNRPKMVEPPRSKVQDKGQEEKLSAEDYRQQLKQVRKQIND